MPQRQGETQSAYTRRIAAARRQRAARARERERAQQAPQAGEKRKRGAADLYAVAEDNRVNVLRPRPAWRYYYVYIEKLEVERVPGGVEYLHMIADCMLADWFDANVGALPDMDALPAEAGAVLLDFTVSRGVLDNISHAVNVPHIQSDWWLKFWLQDDWAPNCGEACAFPILGGDAATMGDVDNETTMYVRTIERIRPPARLVQLQAFSSNTNI